ncbi:uncharacterized protein LOC120356459 [Nilaparvata lugens]|uniref:uncharacterized protein LOC120356459 n=1 Tax=Nilaparvata lugens TaxID=108931 RepID=UPI00193D1689|nr:uncharacterized protein LOC120356459 [Nilaparvata lugens]
MLQVFVNRCLRRIMGIRWPEVISNEALWEYTCQDPIQMQIKRRNGDGLGTLCARKKVPLEKTHWTGILKDTVQEDAQKSRGSVPSRQKLGKPANVVGGEGVSTRQSWMEDILGSPMLLKERQELSQVSQVL